MKYNFDKLSERRHTHSEKWNIKDNELPMWVADMDFMVMPEIQEAVKNAATDGSYGYSYPTEEFFKAYQNWWKSRHDLLINTNNLICKNFFIVFFFIGNINIIRIDWCREV